MKNHNKYDNIERQLKFSTNLTAVYFQSYILVTSVLPVSS